MFIYLLINKENGKYYVGKTVHHNLNSYLSNKRCVARKGSVKYPIVAAIAKYGIDNFDVQVLAEPVTIAELNNLEQLWIVLLNSQDPKFGYNILSGGEVSRLGIACSEDTKRKIGQANKGKKPKGYVRTDKHRQQLRDRMRGNKIGIKITSEIAKQWKDKETLEQKQTRCKAIKAAWDRRKLLKGEDFVEAG